MLRPISALLFPLFGALGAADAAALGPLLRPRRYVAGQVVFLRGDPAEDVFVVTAGQLRISVCAADGRELAFRVANAGEMVGEIGVLDGHPRSADVTALRPSEVQVLTRADLRALLQARPGLALQVIHFLCRRLRETSEQLEALVLLRIEVRLARFLLRLLDAGGTARGEVELTLGISQGEIAGLIGASRPKVNLAFSALEEQGAIRREGKRLICRVETLTGIAEGQHD